MAEHRHFDTPSWLGPDRHGTAPPEPVLPVQAMPAHDAIAPDHVPVALSAPPAGLLQSGHWEERRSPQFIAGVLLLFAWLGLVFFTTLAILLRSGVYAGGGVACLAAMILIRSMLMSAGLTIVDLRGSQLTVHRDGLVDTIDLASSYAIVEVTGRPGSRGWRLIAETVDGRLHQLGRRQVDSVALDLAVRYYRLIAKGRLRPHDDIDWQG